MARSRIPGEIEARGKAGVLDYDQLGYRNLLINGDFIVGQRATAWDADGTNPANNDGVYIFDRWILLSDGNDVVDITQETSTIPTGGRSAIKLDVETANKKFALLQVIENKNCVHLLDTSTYQRCSLSFKARSSSATPTVDHLRAAVLSWKSTADTLPDTDIISAWGAAGTDPTLEANWTYENTPSSLATLSQSYQTFKIEGVAVDTASTANVAVMIWSDDVTTTAGEFVYITDVQLELGSVATPFERRPFSLEHQLCMRYYCKTFDYDVNPAQNTTDTNGAISCRAGGTNDGAVTVWWQYPVMMRDAPSVTLYNPNAADTKWDSTVDIPSLAGDIGHSSCKLTNTDSGSTAATDNANYQIHATAEKEL
jgi:hypothetical protein